MKNLDLIEKYFDNTLSPEDHILFKELLQNDIDFKNEFVFQKDLKKVITIDQQVELKNKLQDFEENIPKNPRIFNLKKNWLAAATIALVFGISFGYFMSNYFPSEENLYAQNFVPYRNIIQPINRGAKENTIKYRAFLAYENKNYHKAINLFNSIKNNDENYVPFYKAMCYLSINNPSDAILLLIPIADSLNRNNIDKNFDQLSIWYLGLAYLKIGNKKEAISKFSFIANYPTDFCHKKEAKKMLELLN